MFNLPPGNSTVVVVTNPPLQKEIRVPFLWGFAYVSEPRWKQALDDTLWGLSSKKLPGPGMLYTNYLTVTPP